MEGRGSDSRTSFTSLHGGPRPNYPRTCLARSRLARRALGHVAWSF